MTRTQCWSIYSRNVPKKTKPITHSYDTSIGCASIWIAKFPYFSRKRIIYHNQDVSVVQPEFKNGFLFCIFQNKMGMGGDVNDGCGICAKYCLFAANFVIFVSATTMFNNFFFVFFIEETCLICKYVTFSNRSAQRYYWVSAYGH